MEHEAAIGDFIAEALEDAGYTVWLVRDRAHMFATLAVQEPDLLLYAIDRLGRYASEIITAIRVMAGTTVPIVLMSTDASARGVPSQADCLSKPFTLDELFDCAAQHIRARSIVA
jgi:DNA-binding response OmpR family regulator